MANDLTAKDVLYALEYLGDVLDRTSIRDGKAKWEMRKSGIRVKDSIANEVRLNPEVISTNHLTRQTIEWKKTQ